MWPKACTLVRRKRSINTPQIAVTGGASSSASQKLPVMLTNWKPRYADSMKNEAWARLRTPIIPKMTFRPAAIRNSTIP